MGFPALEEKEKLNKIVNKREYAQSLLLEILSLLPDSHRQKRTLKSGKMQELVFSLNIDGIRYTLLRSYERPSPPPSDQQLSPREQEIARLVAKGFPNKAIGTLLEISPWTVATHLRRIFAKLGVGSRTEMVARVMKDGMLDSGS